MTIYGWAFGIINASLNPAGADRRVRVDDAVVRFDDRRKAADSPLIGCSSTIRPGEPFVVWIVDRAQAWGLEGYTVAYSARSRVFGGAGTYDTLDEAIAAYDRLRGIEVEQLALFGGTS